MNKISEETESDKMPEGVVEDEATAPNKREADVVVPNSGGEAEPPGTRYLPWLRRFANAVGEITPPRGNVGAEDGEPSPCFENISFERQFIGHAEGEAGCRIRGWVVQSDNISSTVNIDVLVDGELWWQGEARRFWTFDPEGVPFQLPVGFSVDLPSPTPQHSRWSVEVRTTVDGAPLMRQPVVVDAADRFEGFIDEILALGGDQFNVEGWVRDLAEPLVPVDVEIVLGDRRLATVTASRFREDLRGSGAGSVNLGFRVAVSAEGGNLDSIYVLVSATRAPLSRHANTRIAAAPPVSVPPSLRLAAFLAGDVVGNVDLWSATEVSGWARSVLMPDHPIQLDLLIDNHLFASTFASNFRLDLQLHFNDHGFHAFQFELPPNYRPLRPLNLRVLPRNIKGEIGNAQHTLLSKIIGVIDNAQADQVVVANHIYRSPPYLAAAGEAAPPLCALIVLNLNGANLLEEFFASFQRHNSYPNVEILIIDQGSFDDSEKVCRRWSALLQIKFVSRGRNFTFAESNNYGARLTDARFLFFVNNDISFLQDFLRDAVEMLRDPSIGVLGACLLDTPLGQGSFSQPLIQHLGVHYSPSPTDRSVHPVETRFLPHLHDVHRSPWKVPSVTGAFMICRRDDFEALGGFCEDYNYGYEDIDFCLGAALRLGKQVVSANHLSAYHLRGYSRKRSGVWSGETMLRNRRVLERRYGYPARRRQREELFTRPGYWTSDAPRIAFAVTEASDTTSAGDYFTAKGLAEELIQLVDATIIYLEESKNWYDLQGVDVLIAMRSEYDLGKITNAGMHLLKVGWARNWIETWGAQTGYDVMWAASAKAAAYLMTHLCTPVEIVPIATNPKAFPPVEAVEDLISDYCFTGSFWHYPRDIIYRLDPAALPFRFAVFGRNWDQVPNFVQYNRGQLPYSRMAAVYASTKIVVDDANSATKQWGSVNSRVFDALAAGALVITNGVEGAQSLFDGLLPTYSTRQELEALLWRYLKDEDERRALVEKLRRKVLESHTYAHRARQTLELLKAVGHSQLRIAIKIGAPNQDVREEWGDYRFALALRKAFSRKGHTVRIDCLDSWYAIPTLGDDVVLVLRGLTRYNPRADQINLAWVISHPNELSTSEFESYDHVFVASEPYGRQLAAQIKVPVTPLLQCTDPELFYDAVEQPNTATDVLFVGNSRNVFRRIVKDSYVAGLDVSVYGRGWKGFLPDEYIKGEHIQNEELAAHYRHAGVVLNDHWDDMREKGFISNRLFDCVASGARVISDPVPGMRELFGDLVATYSSAKELPGLVEALRMEPEARRAERAALAARIRQDHSFEVRATKIMNVIKTLDDAKRSLLPPSQTWGC